MNANILRDSLAKGKDGRGAKEASTKVRGAVQAADGASPGDVARMALQRRALILRGAPVDVAVGAVAAIGVALAGLGRIEPGVLLVWTLLLLGIGGARIFAWRSAAARRRAVAAIKRFDALNMTLLAAKGALWGAIAPAYLTGGAYLQALFPLVVAILSGSSAATAGASWRSVLAFNAPLLLATATAYALLVEDVGMAAAAAIIAYGGALAIVAKNLETTILRSIRIRTRDETNFRLMERRLDAANESEARFRSLVEASRELTIIFSPDGRITYVSPSVGDVLGASPAAYIGRTTKELVRPDDLKTLKDAGAKSLTRMGEATAVPSICFVGADGACRTLGGRLVNMLYVRGVEGFVFIGGEMDAAACPNHPGALPAGRRG